MSSRSQKELCCSMETNTTLEWHWQPFQEAVPALGKDKLDLRSEPPKKLPYYFWQKLNPSRMYKGLMLCHQAASKLKLTFIDEDN